MRTIRSIRLDGFLSFAPGAPRFKLRDLNVLVGENGAGKTNFIEALELLSAAPRDFAARVRLGGEPEWWKWRGDGMEGASPTLEVVLDGEDNPAGRPLRYRLGFDVVGCGTAIVEETLEEAKRRPGADAVVSFYSLREGRVLDAGGNGRRSARPIGSVGRGEIDPGQSVLSRLKDVERFPELAWVGGRLDAIRSSRDWSFGLDAPARQFQSADLPGGGLLRDARNLASVVDRLDPKSRRHVDDVMQFFFLPSRDLSVEGSNGSARVHLRVAGCPLPLPPARLSDATLRFLSMLVALQSPEPPSVLCIDEPENGLHPSAVRKITREIMKASEATRQLVVATQSSKFLSELTNDSEIESVIACERRLGETVMSRLDPKELRDQQGGVSLGDMRACGALGSI